MKTDWWKLPAALGLGFLGGILATLAMRMMREPALLINSDVIGAAIGASLTIGATLVIENFRRRNEQLRRLDPLRQALRATSGVAAAGLMTPAVDKELAQRADDTATVYGAFSGARQTLEFARSRADVHDPRLWLNLEQLERAFDRFEEQRVSAKQLLCNEALTEAVWANADNQLKAFCALLRARIEDTERSIERAS